MAKGYRPVDRDQGFLLPPDMRDWLPAGHVVWLVIEAVRLLDTSVFHARRRTGGAGAAGYDPVMMVTLLIWAYANGVTSSRRIERLCGQDVAFRVVCAGNLPDHVTIARFRQEFAGTAVALFGQVLVLCARLGMGQVGTVALDGTKIAASASKEANRTEEGLRKLAGELAARHAETDAAEDGLSGAGQRGDDDPGDPHTRRDRVAAALASLAKERQDKEAAERAAAQAHLRAAQAGTPPAGRPPAGAEVEAARGRLAKETADCQARVSDWERRKAAGQRPGRRPVGPGQSSLVRRAQHKLDRALEREAARQAAQAAVPPPVRNLTDPHSRLMPVRGGAFIQGCNAQNATSRDGMIIATCLTDDSTDTRWWQPMMDQAAGAAAAMAAAGGPGTGQIGLSLSDAGYLSEHNLTCPGPDRLIATGKRRDLEQSRLHRQPGPGRSRGSTANAHRRDDSPAGHPPRHHRLPDARPHRRDPARQHQAQPGHPPPVHARHQQGIRRVDLHLRRPQPHHRHHQRPPHHLGPGHPHRLAAPGPAGPAHHQPAPHTHPPPPQTGPAAAEHYDARYQKHHDPGNPSRFRNSPQDNQNAKHLGQTILPGSG